MSYQPLPDLSPEDYELLKADIAQHGCLVPIETDEAGNVLDGHHRQRICGELGISPPVVIRAGLTEAQKHEHALRLNLVRRHLTTEQKREIIRAELDRDPNRSDREIGRLCGVDHKTVGKVRRGEIPTHYSRIVAAAVAEEAARREYLQAAAEWLVHVATSEEVHQLLVELLATMRKGDRWPSINAMGLFPADVEGMLAEINTHLEAAGAEPLTVDDWFPQGSLA